MIIDAVRLKVNRPARIHADSAGARDETSSDCYANNKGKIDRWAHSHSGNMLSEPLGDEFACHGGPVIDAHIEVVASYVPAIGDDVV